MPNLETNGGDLDQQQSLIIKVKLSDDAYGSPDERALLADIEEAIQSRLADGGAGVFDGDEFGDGCCTILLYGPVFLLSTDLWRIRGHGPMATSRSGFLPAGTLFTKE